MAATYTAEHLRSRSERRMVDHDPDATTAQIVDLDPASSDKCLPIALFRRFLAGVVRTVGTGTISSLEIIAATAADGTGATVVASHALGSAPNAVGDTIWLEVDAAQIHEVLPAATHVGVRIALAVGTDECVVFFERAEPVYAYSGLTADYIS
jgi:hypothetical protein